LVIVFDVRLAIDVDHEKFENMIKQWCDEAGGDIEISYEQKRPFIEPTKVDNTNPYWVAFKEGIEEL
jgi:aminoacylase